MACNRRCNICNNLVAVTKIEIVGGNLVLTIPEGTYENHKQVCLMITQNIPVSDTILPIVIKIGEDTRTFYLLNKNGNFVYSDQIKSRRLYGTSFKTDTRVFKYNGHYNLPCTQFVFEPIVVD